MHHLSYQISPRSVPFLCEQYAWLFLKCMLAAQGMLRSASGLGCCMMEGAICMRNGEVYGVWTGKSFFPRA